MKEGKMGDRPTRASARQEAAGHEHAEPRAETVEVGRRLRSARETLGLTQEDVAAALNVQRTSVIAMEAGKRNVTALELRRLARLYRRDVSWLLGEGLENLDSAAAENQALFRATAQLSEEDKQQVLRFAQFLATGKPAALDSPAPAAPAAGKRARLPRALHHDQPSAGE
jgi:transcriptional regulator with XRE-family HTH domain